MGKWGGGGWGDHPLFVSSLISSSRGFLFLICLLVKTEENISGEIHQNRLDGCFYSPFYFIYLLLLFFFFLAKTGKETI